METTELTRDFTVSPQIKTSDIPEIAARGFRSIICNRPDGEVAEQPSFSEIAAAAEAHGITARHIPYRSGHLAPSDVKRFADAVAALPKPILAYCRSGKRSSEIWSAAEAVSGIAATPATSRPAKAPGDASHEVVIIGGGAAGIATAASLLSRDGTLDIAIVEPADTHYYQPGWTMVGGGIFAASDTAKPMQSVMPAVKRISDSVLTIDPSCSQVVTSDGRRIGYRYLVVCPGLRLDWGAVEGLPQTLGANGVTSNYRYDLAPYTWKLVQELRKGRAVFTQPPMPIKCAGAPQKALYLSADYWLRQHRLNNIEVAFYNAGAVLFGVPKYVPPLMEYMKRYRAQLNFGHNLVAVDGPGRRAYFKIAVEGGEPKTVQTSFDMLHVVPPQTAPDFIRNGPLADAAGWVDVDQASLRHKKFENVFALGDVSNAPNAKTAAAARKQAPVVAENLLAARKGKALPAAYDGYGSCPLTVERGKVVLAEFVYGGKVCESFPNWMIDGSKPSHLAWLLKKDVLPSLYWNAMLKGREWLAKPHRI